MPSSCDHGNSGNYAVRHNPAVYYTTLHGRSGSDVAYSRLTADLAHNQLPAFSLPNSSSACPSWAWRPPARR